MISPTELARYWVESNAIVIDTETTGLGPDAEVIEVAAIDCCGLVLLNTLVKPWQPSAQLQARLPSPRIPADATAVHGITDAMVADAPSWEDVHGRLFRLVSRRQVVIYNSEYDVRLLRQSAALVDLDSPLSSAGAIGCAMLAYAEHKGDWNSYRNGYKWHKLTSAAAQLKIDTTEFTAHRALGDCQMTLAVIRAMAQGGI